MIKSKYFILFATILVSALLLCSCSNASNDTLKRDMGDIGNDIMGTSNGYGYNTGSYNAGVYDSTVTGGDTVGNSVNAIMGGKAVGERDGISGTSTHGTRNNVKKSEHYAGVNTNRGTADGGKKVSNGSAASVNGIDSRSSGGSGTPNYTK